MLTLKDLDRVEAQLPDMLASAEWRTLDIDYEPPRVERLWTQIGDMRVCLHRIHKPAEDAKPLYHRHPWPSAMRVVEGRYAMGIGYGSIGSGGPPPLAGTLILPEGAAYEMPDPDLWHWVMPITPTTLSLMVTGKPWTGDRAPAPKPDRRLGPLSDDARAEILAAFKWRLVDRWKILSGAGHTDPLP